MSDTLKKLTSESLSICVTAIAMLCFFSILTYVAVPRFVSWQSLVSENERYRILVEKETGRVAIKEQIAGKKAQLAAKWMTLTGGIGTPGDLSSLLSILFERAFSAGVRVDKTLPQKETVDGSGHQYTLVLDVSAPYTALGQYVSHLEQLPHLVRIDRMALTARPDNTLFATLLVTCFLSDQPR